MTIKFKVVISVIVVLVLGTIGLLYVTNTAYKNNSELIAKRSLQNAKESFANLQKNDLKMMTAVVEELVLNADIKDAYIKRDRDKLIAITKPKYDVYKSQYGITQWNFIDADPETKMVLRLTMPEKFDDPIKRTTLKNAVSSGKISYGTELGNTGFAIRAVKPYFYEDKLIGYIELGEEINKFAAVLKELTGNEFGLVLKKSLLKESDWITTQKAWGQKNNWNDQEKIVIATNTTNSEKFLKYNDDIESLPDEGKIIGTEEYNGKIYIKGVFPIKDVKDRKVGGVFVLTNIDEITKSMESSQQMIVIFIVIQAILICLILLFILFQLIFKRLTSMIDKIESVVGGEFHTAIVPKSNDEIGKFEVLFEQFRKVFVNILDQMK